MRSRNGSRWISSMCIPRGIENIIIIMMLNYQRENTTEEMIILSFGEDSNRPDTEVSKQ